MEGGFRSYLLEILSSDSISSVLIPDERQITPRQALIMLVFISCICTNVWMNDWMTEQVCLRERLEKNRRKWGNRTYHTFPESAVSLLWGNQYKEFSTVAEWDADPAFVLSARTQKELCFIWQWYSTFCSPKCEIHKFTSIVWKA